MVGRESGATMVTAATQGYDAVIVGAGPGGSAAAITLARAGLRVALLDRQAFPRTKPCGDLIGCGGVALARALGVNIGDLGAYAPLRGAVVLAPDAASLVLTARPHPSRDARVVPRHVFDTALVRAAERAGADFVRLHVRDLVRDSAGCVIGVRGEGDDGPAMLTARAVIGADGYGSRIARAVRGDETMRAGQAGRAGRVGQVGQAGQVGVALRAYAENVRVPEAWRGCLVFAYERHTAPGYGWMMPLPDGGANLGIGTLVPADKGGNADAAHLRDLFARFLDGSPWLAGATVTHEWPPRSWPLALGPRSGPLVADGVLLVGEAASLVGPMTGAGIYPALQSGVWAGETLIRALIANSVSRTALLPYERRVRRRFAPQHAAEAVAQRILADPRRLRRIANLARSFPFAGPLGASLLLHLG